MYVCMTVFQFLSFGLEYLIHSHLRQLLKCLLGLQLPVCLLFSMCVISFLFLSFSISTYFVLNKYLGCHYNCFCCFYNFLKVFPHWLLEVF